MSVEGAEALRETLGCGEAGVPAPWARPRSQEGQGGGPSCLFLLVSESTSACEDRKSQARTTWEILLLGRDPNLAK